VYNVSNTEMNESSGQADPLVLVYRDYENTNDDLMSSVLLLIDTHMNPFNPSDHVCFYLPFRAVDC
jgi:hypothetical protein